MVLCGLTVELIRTHLLRGETMAKRVLHWGNGWCSNCRRYVRTSTKGYKDDLEVQCIGCKRWIEIMSWSTDLLKDSLPCHLSRGTLREIAPPTQRKVIDITEKGKGV